MKITKIDIKNFRLLKDFSIDLEENLSLVIGKNNTGKTSFLTALERFIGSSEKRFTYDDFNIELREQIIALIEGNLPEEAQYRPLGINARIEIEYDDNDNLSDVSKLIMSLDPDDRLIILEFSYELNFNQLQKLKEQFTAEGKLYNGLSGFLKENLTAHIPSIISKSVSSTNENNWIDLQKEKIQLNNVIGFQYISAKRDVTNRDNDKTLSTQTSRIYKKTSASEDQKAIVDDFKAKLRRTDEELTTIYSTLFSDVIDKIKRFGGLKGDDTLINIVSSLQHRELLEGNTTVTYKHDCHDLPEHYNGLGYMNLISMIFEIEVIINQLKKGLDESPAALNILFIEEPEAHTHPQMQYIFIKNIKSLLDESRNKAGGTRLSLQTVVSTHSSHIVAESDFDDIKYLKRVGTCSVKSINLKNLKEKYSENEEEERHYKFLKQYLTLNRSEIFFADKTIMIEGDTERILIPAMMKKIDQEEHDDKILPLLSQNISIIEVGAHSKTFSKFIEFLGVKTLIITDIDTGYIEITSNPDGSEKKEQHKCLPNDPKVQFISNSSLTFFHGKPRENIKYFFELKNNQKCVSKDGDGWNQDDKGFVFLAYQTEENGYHSRSFEDAFFSLNHEFLFSKGHDYFQSVTKKWYDKYEEDHDHFKFAESGVGSKPSLAIEILLNSDDDASGNKFSNWIIPAYIKEGLLWLRQG
jgi:predicted ATP-dependent endonuclease of OLD family